MITTMVCIAVSVIGAIIGTYIGLKIADRWIF